MSLDFSDKMAKSKNIKKLPKDIKKIGLRLRAIRKNLGYGNSDEFANKYELDRAQYGKYETGSQDFRMSSLIKILDSIGYRLSDFFNEDYDNIEI
ncbi:helix-turn-helix domain-containing protein [Pedobacter helvus]|uniref:Helix-turn-helix domain-containing protein n=1 Tax=Pedobacter helvus TaxID=2563444 RepID=A0ABW9JKY9_9SPHI|nr:helix-turn-helix transcriptional regulator [Pedobacter ureilyticus]